MSAVLLEVEHLSRSFGGVAALDDAGFAVEEGSITALIGPNGAGKTTAFNVISGFLKPDAGIVRFAGRRIEGLRGDQVARAGLVRAFQAPRVLTRMSVLDNMLLAGKDQPGERLSLTWLAPGRVAARELEVHRRAIDLLELLRLLPLAEAYDKLMDSDAADIKNISGGREAGSITAAQFIQRFVNDVPWAHLDIAGTTWSKKDAPIVPKGATAFGLRLLDRFIAEHYEG